ncbi:hypothetical protein BDQ12DRAFT_129639 [Crucibulum laeve]|uniref:F-box domain-containing protein n=1 Tax=Crucibulum laeve TaxID=68775 RepID=A0A5C3LFU5_9AGAR|nr:hypothetical protein BDQ12DRAFT_129639 [Crucibulum laeve]
MDAKHITPYTFIRLAQLHPAPIFPALRLLRFSDSESRNIRKVKHIAAGCFLLVSPAIKTLIIDRFGPDPTEHNSFFEAFFVSLTQGSTNIHDLTVDGRISHWKILASSCNLRNLCFYKKFGQNWTTYLSVDIKSLRSFNNLTSIKINVDIEDRYNSEDIQNLLQYVPELNSSECLNCLPHLNHMTLIGDVALFVLVLQHIPSNNLKSILILSRERFDMILTPLWALFFEQLSHCQYLEHILILGTKATLRTPTASDFACIISQKHLQSLLKLKHLWSLQISGYIIADLHEAFIVQLALLWNQLSDLYLPDSQLVPTVGSTAQSLGALSHIALHHPNLKVLKLSVNATDLAITIPSNYHSRSRLRELFLSTRDDVRDLAAPQRLLLARYIYRVFPSLKVVSGVEKEFWEEINAMVQAFKAVRQEALSETLMDHHNSITTTST